MKKRDSLYFEKLEDNFQNWASGYDEKARENLINQLLFPIPRTYMRCLEVGCGYGRMTRVYKHFFNEYIASDISADLCRKTAEENNVLAKIEDALNLSIEDNYFDCVISSECIEHTTAPLKAIEEMARVVRPGGKLVFTTPNLTWHPILVLSQLLKLRKFRGNENWISAGQTVNVLRKANFESIKVLGCHLFPWQIPGAKIILPYFDKIKWLRPFMINFGISAIKKS